MPSPLFTGFDEARICRPGSIRPTRMNTASPIGLSSPFIEGDSLRSHFDKDMRKTVKQDVFRIHFSDRLEKFAVLVSSGIRSAGFRAASHFEAADGFQSRRTRVSYPSSSTALIRKDNVDPSGRDRIMSRRGYIGMTPVTQKTLDCHVKRVPRYRHCEARPTPIDRAPRRPCPRNRRI